MSRTATYFPMNPRQADAHIRTHCVCPTLIQCLIRDIQGHPRQSVATVDICSIYIFFHSVIILCFTYVNVLMQVPLCWLSMYHPRKGLCVIKWCMYMYHVSRYLNALLVYACMWVKWLPCVCSHCPNLPTYYLSGNEQWLGICVHRGNVECILYGAECECSAHVVGVSSSYIRMFGEDWYGYAFTYII